MFRSQREALLALFVPHPIASRRARLFESGGLSRLGRRDVAPVPDYPRYAPFPISLF